jgi:hypothetical protein
MKSWFVYRKKKKQKQEDSYLPKKPIFYSYFGFTVTILHD